MVITRLGKRVDLWRRERLRYAGYTLLIFSSICVVLALIFEYAL